MRPQACKPAMSCSRRFISSAETITPFIRPPAGWTQIRADQYNMNSHYGEQYLFYKVAGSSEPASYTFTQPTNSVDYCSDLGGEAIAYSGVNTASPVDASGCNYGYPNTYGSTISAPSITTANANDQLLFLYSILDQASLGYDRPSAPVYTAVV